RMQPGMKARRHHRKRKHRTRLQVLRAEYAEYCLKAEPPNRAAVRIHPALVSLLILVKKQRQAQPAALALIQSRCTCGDRQSTRLNSSHVSKSYAVLCLKERSKMRLLSSRAL